MLKSGAAGETRRSLRCCNILANTRRENCFCSCFLGERILQGVGQQPGAIMVFVYLFGEHLGKYASRKVSCLLFLAHIFSFWRVLCSKG